MSWHKLLGMVLVLSAYGCKSAEAAGGKAADEIKATAKELVGKNEAAAPLTEKPAGTTLLQKKLDRLSIDTNSNEVRTKPGRTICDVTDKLILTVQGDDMLKKVKSALEVLSKNRGKFAQAYFVMGKPQSIEIVGFAPDEFLIESSYSHQEVLTEVDASKKGAFDSALSTVFAITNDKKICPE